MGEKGFGFVASLGGVREEKTNHGFHWSWVLMSFLMFGVCPAGAEPLRMASPVLALEWAKQGDGWALREVVAGGKAVGRPQGFTNVVFSRKKPNSGEVLRDGAGENFTFYFAEADRLAENRIRFRHRLAVADVESVWEIDADFPTDIRVVMKLTAKEDGYFSVASPTLATIAKEEMNWGMIPGNWYGRELENTLGLAGQYSMGVPSVPFLATERNSGTLCPLIETRDGITLAVIPEPNW